MVYFSFPFVGIRDFSGVFKESLVRGMCTFVHDLITGILGKNYYLFSPEAK